MPLINKLILKKFHFTSMIILIINFLMGIVFKINFNAIVILLFNTIIYVSGIVLLFLSLRHKKLLPLYYSLYIFLPVAVLLAWLADGIFGALLGTIFFALLVPPDTIRQYNNYELRSPFSGVLSNCCSYDIFQSHYLLFERKVASFNCEHSLDIIKDFRVFKDKKKAFVYFYDAFNGVDSTVTVTLE
ncbi:hypothetical protein GXP67_32170 [Rhodocytophaga rosea]|uniref:Uncharacterized protein n=1 Tax=Rhodocytophaga rosea TaxID=2704465 RepID=A0A6C0GT41_9BACT|nr:hypothetical protein [Rhodocytophaga rosea]QHT70974.1 hypothetical protein GXP67_32170 [Rhodocytophaga rosea]